MLKRPAGGQILEYLSSKRAEFVAFLELLTIAESPSVVPASQGAVRNIIADRLNALGFRTFKLPGRSNGGAAIGALSRYHRWRGRWSG